MNNLHSSSHTNIDSYPTPYIEYKPEPNYWLRRAVAVGLVATVAMGIPKGIDMITSNEKSVKYIGLETEVAQDERDTIWNMANKIDGVGSVVTTQEAVNYLIETNPGLSDGLSQGEAVERPVSVVASEDVVDDAAVADNN
jgi:hypothetical protein